jgi:hypothetical protein
MSDARDARFVEEATHFKLVMHCEDCTHFDPDGDRCVHGYPIDAHRRRPLEEGVVFCKEFEAL